MKKLFAIVLLVVIAMATLFVFVGCTNNKEETVPAVTGITAKVATDAKFTVGSQFDSKYITVVASLDDKTTKTVSTTAAISYDLADIKLDAEGKFTEAGQFEMDVKFSDWSTKVTIVVKAA